MATKYSIIEIKDNAGTDAKNSSYSTFDVLAEFEGNKKWISVEHGSFFVWAMHDSKKLELYIESKNFRDWDSAILDLTELNYDWKHEMGRYMEDQYPKKIFVVLPKYKAEDLNDFLDDDDDDF